MPDLNRELIELIKENTKIITQLVNNQDLMAKTIESLQDSVSETVNTNEEIIAILSGHDKSHDPKLYEDTCKDISKLINNDKYNLKEILYNINTFKMVGKIRTFIVFTGSVFSITALWSLLQFILFIIDKIQG
jgi:hypothetical protein